MSTLIDGKSFANGSCGQLKSEVEALKAAGINPGIAVILVGDDPASHAYVANKVKRCAEIGLYSEEIHLASDIGEQVLLGHLERLNADSKINGILVQLPLPKHIDENLVINAIVPEKDVDGFSLINSGALMTGQRQLVPCTPLGCLHLLKDQLGDLSGKHAVVIGRSNIVGKPMAMLLLQESCTVSVVHSRTKDIQTICQQADIVVAAVGVPKLVTKDWLKPGAVVIDVGINRVEEDGKPRLVGDVDFESASEVAAAITPVPGGVGPMTIAMLMHNTVAAAKQQAGRNDTLQTPQAVGA